MAREFAVASTQYLTSASSPITAAPMSMSAWCYPFVDATHTIMSITNTTTANNVWRFHLFNSIARFQVQDSQGPLNNNTTNTYNLNQWNHICALTEKVAADQRYLCMLNGDWDNRRDLTSSLNRDPAGTNNIAIGALLNTSASQTADARIGECGVWDVALSRAELEGLAAGMSPLLIRPESLVFYAPLIRDEDRDIVGGLSLTPVNGPTVATHPRLYDPMPAQVPVFTSAAPPEPTTALFAHSYRIPSLGMRRY